MSEEAVKAAEALQAEWSIRTSSRFCNDEPEWDAAPTEKIAEALDRELHIPELLAVVEAAKDYVKDFDPVHCESVELRRALDSLTTKQSGRKG